MTASNTPQPATERELDVEADPQPQSETPKPEVPQEDDPAIEDTQEQPS